MGWESQIKSVGLCFFRTGVQTELFFPSGRADAATALALFLDSDDAAILSAENFSRAELSYLRGKRNVAGRRLFVEPECAGRAPVGRGSRCGKTCPLRKGADRRGD